jgi:NADH-quinone oxidoreductase subunit C
MSVSSLSNVPTMPDATALVASLQDAVPGATVEAAPTVDLQTTVYLSRDDVPAAARALRDRPELRYTLLAELTAVDYHPREPRFELVYLLVSLEHRRRLRLKVRLQGDDARVPTVTGVWPAANWLEREVWDLFGIVFDGHPDPRRLLMPEDWDGFPLRKDYPVQIKMTPRASEPLQVTEQEFRANLERDRLTRS